MSPIAMSKQSVRHTASQRHTVSTWTITAVRTVILAATFRFSALVTCWITQKELQQRAIRRIPRPLRLRIGCGSMSGTKRGTSRKGSEGLIFPKLHMGPDKRFHLLVAPSLYVTMCNHVLMGQPLCGCHL